MVSDFYIFPLFTVVSPGRRTEESAPTITEQPKSLIVIRGDPASFNCKAEGRPEPTISWLKNGQPLVIRDSRHNILDSGSLFFLQVVGNRQGGQDGGVYQCVAENSLGTAYSANATLEIAYLKAEFREEPVSDQLISGDSAVLECTPPRGYPAPEVTWLKDDEPIILDNNRVKIVEDGNLLLKELRKDDEGEYKCKAQNMAGEMISKEAYLTVQVKPSFINPPQDTITAPGEAAVLRCEVEGDPPPTVSWSREIGDLPQDRSQQLADNSLRIRHTEELDDGVYICTAENIWGTSDAKARLRVSAVPDFIRAPRDKTIHVNEMVRFQCEAVGSPPPSIHWQKAGTEDNLLFINQQRGRFEVSSSGELQINPVHMEDAGTYICYATGGTGVAEAKAVLRVLGSETGGDEDESLAPPPIIQYGPANQTLLIGSTATFRCHSNGNPSPHIDWTKDGLTLSTTNPRFNVMYPDSTLEITGVQIDDSGLYTCIATSNSGETSLSANLVVVDTPGTSERTAPSTNEFPGAPSQPLRVNVTRSSIQVQWTAPAASRAPSVTGYQVEYFSPEQTIGWVVAGTGIQGQTYNLHHLVPSSSYLVIVRAINSNGIGPPSPVSETIATTDETSNPGPSRECLVDKSSISVEITTIIALSSTAIKVSWEVHAPTNDDLIDGYQVRYLLSDGASRTHFQTVVGMMSTILTGLDPNVDYTVSVRPQICNSKGQESPSVAARTMSEGSGPLCIHGDNQILQNKLDGSNVHIVGTETVGSNAIQVKWEMARNAVAYVEGFHIKYRSSSSSSTNYSVETITGPGRTFVLNGLSSWKEYSISVQPFSGLYCGAEGHQIKSWTAADRPRGPPRNVKAQSNGTTAVLVRWQAPARDLVQGYIEGYYISCRGNQSSQARNRTIQGNTTLVGRVGGLQAGKVYKIQVAAFTAAGAGPSSPVVLVTVATPAPIDAVPGPGDPETMDGETTKPWVYAIIATIVFIIALVLIAFILRRRRMKHAANLTKNPLGIEGATHMTTLTSQYDGQPTSNGHPSWPPDQTWRSNNSSECQSSSLHGNGSATAAVTTFAPQHPNGSLRSVLGKNQYLQPHHSGATTSPAYWLLEAYESKEQMQAIKGEKGDIGTHKSNHYNSNNVPVYAVVDNESDDDDESPSCPHMAHTLPLNQCNHMLTEHCQSLPPHMTEPYASTTLVLPPNIREYIAQRQNCSDTSSGSASGSITYPLPASQHKGRKKSGKKGRPGDDGGPPLPPQRDGSHLCVECQSGLSDSGASSQGSRRKVKTRPGAGSKYPACNWTEFLPPPPEEPPMGSQDPVGKIKSPPPCNSQASHPPIHTHPTFVPIQPAMIGGHHPHHAPALPMRQHPQYPVYPYTHPHPQSNGLPHTLPVISRGDEQQTTTLPIHRPMGLVNGQMYPMPTGGMSAGGQPLAPHQVFDDPRHEQLGRELLEFNDDLMSQSEAMSDNEEALPMLPRIAPDTGLADQSSKLIPDDLETDLETSSNCTGSMMASWASMNGSSTAGSNRNSASSCSSDGSFCAETDFAAAVTAAAQNAGIPVVGSPPAESKKVGRDLDGGEHIGNGSAKLARRTTPNSRKGPTVPTSLFPQPTHHQQQLARVPTSESYNNYHQQQTQPQAPSQRSLPPPPASSDGQQQDSVNKNKRRPPQHDLFLRDTNDLGLTVTANPMAFAHEEEEGFPS
ncbi:roundabout homolog 1-like [Lytechinus pictus]|uniref:roundabout homolog 1-like n=1 Tax=Lytechinus pictus TaxID=7653 RepID=UPI0030BA1D6D